MSTPNKTPIVVERTYKANVKELWDLWTTKKGFESWWGPVGFIAKVHEIDARVGGALRYDMVADSPEAIEAMMKEWNVKSHMTKSSFTALTPHTHLAIRSVIDFIPGVKPYENDISVDFTQSGERVRMVVTLHGMHNAQFTQMQLEGFSSQITKLDARYT